MPDWLVTRTAARPARLAAAIRAAAPEIRRLLDAFREIYTEASDAPG